MPTPRPIPKWVTIPVLLLAALLAGCGPRQPAPEPSPEPASEYTPEPSEAEMYAKAEQAFWGFIETQRKYELTGDYSQFPPEMATYLDTRQLEVTRSLFEEGKAGGWYGTGPGEITTRPAWPPPFEDSVAIMAVCEDGTGVLVLDANGNVVKKGSRFSYYAYFRVADDGLVKLFRISLRGDTLCD